MALLFPSIDHRPQHRDLYVKRILRPICATDLGRHRASAISPLVNNHGRLVVTDAHIYFQAFNNLAARPVTVYERAAVARVVSRRYLLREIGLEIHFADDGGADDDDGGATDAEAVLGTANVAYFAFDTPADRDEVADLLSESPLVSAAKSEVSHRGSLCFALSRRAVGLILFRIYCPPPLFFPLFACLFRTPT